MSIDKRNILGTGPSQQEICRDMSFLIQGGGEGEGKGKTNVMLCYMFGNCAFTQP